MKSKILEFKISYSKIPIISLIILVLLSILVLNYIALPKIKLAVWMVVALITLTWLYRYLIFKPFEIIINTTNLNIKINKKDYLITNIIFLGWWGSVLVLKSPKKYIPIFIDSMSVDSYKKIRILKILI